MDGRGYGTINHMAAEVIRWSALNESAREEALSRLAGALRRGELVVIPTETVYGLAANALDPAAVARIYVAKGRPAHNPLIVHVASAALAQTLVANWPETAHQLADRFWPGPLTMVLPKLPLIPDVTTAGGPTVALRCPATECTRRLIDRAGVPLAAPSANRSNTLSPTRIEHLQPEVLAHVSLVLDAGPCPGGIESTVIDLTEAPPRLLRPGLVSRERLEAMLGPVAIGAKPDAGALRSPGQLARHYAPRTPLFLFSTARKLLKRLHDLQPMGQRIGIVGFGQAKSGRSSGRLRHHPAVARVQWLLDDPAGYANRLYEVLHELDGHGLDCILLLLPPDKPAWQAVRDRLLRAGERAEVGAAVIINAQDPSP
jgi:L-threonylcarbamoyladenylate synthase